MLGPYRSVIITRNLESIYNFDDNLESPIGCLFKTFYYNEDIEQIDLPDMDQFYPYSHKTWYYNILIEKIRDEYEIYDFDMLDIEYLYNLSKYSTTEDDIIKKFVHWLNINKIPFEYE